MIKLEDIKMPICRKCQWLMVVETTYYIPFKRPANIIDLQCYKTNECIYCCDMCDDFKERQSDALWDTTEIFNKLAKIYQDDII